MYIYIFAVIKSNKCIYHFENCIFTLKVVKHSKHTQLQKEFQPPMLAPSMIMPVKITRLKAFSPAQTGEVDRVIGTLTRAQGESQYEVIIQCPLKHRDIGGKNGRSHYWLQNYPWQLWKATLTPDFFLIRSNFQVMKAATIGLTLILLCSSARLSGTSGFPRDQTLPSPKHPALELVPGKYPK